MTANPAQINIKEILKLLPHRYPFIMVDRILEIELGTKILGLKNVTINEPFFQGHFPSEPIMPGVLLLEGMAQAGGILAYLSKQEMIGKELIYFAGLDAVRFRQPVIPGDQVIYAMTVLKHKGKIWKMAGRATVDDKLVAEAELMAAFS
ncbi:MAG: 3-hydroxyacyl-[acyl-carrier-protein] dehydratase FabZ [Deltaproteobacteria bacterium RIFOXYD12_FULL_57_12]|nr:MAG: 3-hydroxyacyl-[acyl-carrier-protein] dehydratase FabZ [Deltaproteobacteria bacterium RIFOXYD12_FULL_57_12]